MKINLTKKLVEHLEIAHKQLKADAKNVTGAEKKELNEVALSISEILVRHENRLEKEY